MFNKNIILRYNEEDKSKIRMVVDKYSSDEASDIDRQKGIGRVIFGCSIFNINKIKNDIQLLNGIGLKVEIKIV